jgi:nitroreductase
MEYDIASVDYILETTRSVRKRLDLTRPVDREVVMECLDIALQAPSGSNAQGWRWLIVTDPDKKARIGEYYKRAFTAYIKGGRPNQAREHGPTAREKLVSSATYLADHMGEVPMMIFACIQGRAKSPGAAAGLYGSIIPAAWSLMLALRTRGIGAAWTTLHLTYEKECNELLGIPADVTTAVLLPVAYFTGETFKKAWRVPARELTYWETWGQGED